MRKTATSEERIALYRTEPCGKCGSGVGNGCRSMGGVSRPVKTHPGRIKRALETLYARIAGHGSMCPCDGCALAKRL